MFSGCTVLLLLASVQLVSVNSWHLIASHKNVIPQLTDDVSLSCSHPGVPGTNWVLGYLTRIRLLKLDGHRWTSLARVTYPFASKVWVVDSPTLSGARLEGNLGDQNTTFLKVMWPTSNDNTVGSYKCEVDGFSKDGGRDTVLETDVVNITHNDATVSDLVAVVVQMRKESDRLADEVKQKDEEHKQIEQTIVNETVSNIVDRYFELRYWPSGTYSLLAAESGCPETDSSRLLPGNARYQTETHNAPNHTFSSPNHLGGAVVDRFGTRNILKFNFCTSTRAEPRLLWPKGAYCIHNAASACPAGFSIGYTRIVPESLIKIIETKKDVSYATSLYAIPRPARTYVQFSTCCRSDGGVADPVRLPTAKPFYLYRYKGKCQEVFNMDVTNEWMQVDTGTASYDVYSTSYHPDGSLNDARFELCYYTKKSNAAL